MQAGPGALVLSRFRRNRQGFIHSGGGGASEWVSEAAGVGLSFTPLWSEKYSQSRSATDKPSSLLLTHERISCWLSDGYLGTGP